MDSALEQLWGTGASTRSIAVQISENAARILTHNAVISRAHRIGLARRANPVPR